MRISWRSDFDKVPSKEPVVFTPAPKRKIAETPNPALDQIEQEVSLMLTMVVLELTTSSLGEGILEEVSPLMRFLAKRESFEGRLRGLLLDASLSRFQAMRLKRCFQAYQWLGMLGQGRRHVELAFRAVTLHTPLPQQRQIQQELNRAFEAVALQAQKAAEVVRTPGWANHAVAKESHECAQRLLGEVRAGFTEGLLPETGRMAKAALLSLEVISAAFAEIACAYSEELRPDELNRMGPPPVHTIKNDTLPL